MCVVFVNFVVCGVCLISSQNCPSTAPCEEFKWRAGQVQCPTECGLPQSTIPVPKTCVGNYGSKGSGVECGPAPRDVRCPSTLPCETFQWRAGQVQCPTECGLPQSMIPVPKTCVGNYGSMGSGVECGPAPRDQKCPATKSCVTYHFEYDVECPDECGLPPSKISPKLTCVGSDTRIAPLSQCSQLTKPIVQCPATEECPRPNNFCPAITFRQQAIKTPGKIELYFIPTNPGAKRMRFDFVDVHYQAPGTPLLNHRMNVNKVSPVVGRKEGIEFGFVVSESEINKLIGTQAELEYSFTYCIELTDCDTQTFYLTL